MANSRIKPFINQLEIHSPVGLQNALDEIRHFFNHVRAHQNLAGLTPAKAWAGLTPTEVAKTPPKTTQLVQALDGLLVGGLRRLVHLKAHASSSSIWVTGPPSVSLRMVNAVRLSIKAIILSMISRPANSCVA